MLKTYNGAPIHHIYGCDADACFKNKSKIMPFVVIKSGGPPLFGTYFLKSFLIQNSKM